MSLPASELIRLIKEALPGALVRVQDTVGDENHYAVYVNHESFNDLTRIEQHKLVYAALKDKLKGELHALALHTEGK